MVIKSNFPDPLQVRLTSSVELIRASLEPYLAWIEEMMGVPLDQTLTLEVDADPGDAVAECLLQGLPLSAGTKSRNNSWHGLIEEWTLPGGGSPRIAASFQRERRPKTAPATVWELEWQEIPVALKLKGLPRRVVSVNVPAVFPPGEPLMLGSSQHWLIVHRQDAAALLLMIQQVQNKAERSLGTVCGAIRLEGRYDWDTLVLDPIVSRMVRRDFQLFFEREKWFRKHNLPYRRGYLFYGNPGNGKTAVIRVMAAHPHIRPYAVDLSDGDNQSSQLVALFEQASRNTPALVILEDLDRAFPTEGKRTRCYNREEQPSFKADDVRRIIAASEAPYDTIWRLAAETGIRRGELCGLNVGDVDLANQIIIVKRSVSKKRTLKSPKNGKARMFALSPQLTEQLKRYADRRGADEPLFLSKMGKRLEPDNFVKRHLKPILKNLGLQGAAHAFRHGNATLLDSLRTPMKVRQDRLGHADPKTTMLYTHSISGDERSTAQQLGALLEQEFLAQDCPKLIPETRMAPESNSEAVAN